MIDDELRRAKSLDLWKRIQDVSPDDSVDMIAELVLDEIMDTLRYKAKNRAVHILRQLEIENPVNQDARVDLIARLIHPRWLSGGR